MLNVGEKLPRISLSLPGGASVVLPDGLQGSWVYLATFRGHW
jgi:hypothetical protein